MKKAFSLLELAIVMSIFGVMASVLHFHFTNNKPSEAAAAILNDLRYTRHLALMQDGLRAGDLGVAKRQWHQSRWQLYFIKSAATNYAQSYTIFLDKNGDGNANLGKIKPRREIAVDIINPRKLISSGQSGVITQEDPRASARPNIQRRFGVQSVDFRGSCAGSGRVVFDASGRPHSPLKNAKNPLEKSLAKSQLPCIIGLDFKRRASVFIAIDSLSGYARPKPSP